VIVLYNSLKYLIWVELMGGAVAESLLTTVLEEAVKRIARKVASGKRLSDSEVMILLLDQMNKRMEERFNALEKNFNSRLDALKEYVDGRLSEMSKRIDDLNKNLNARIDDLSKMVHALSIEVSSIKTDIIKLLKERISS